MTPSNGSNIVWKVSVISSLPYFINYNINTNLLNLSSFISPSVSTNNNKTSDVNELILIDNMRILRDDNPDI
jgi:hypothetical protein